MRSKTTGTRKARIGAGRLLAVAALALIVGAGQGFGQDEGSSTCGATTWNLTAGQHTDVGSVIVENDTDNIYITFTLDYPDACFGMLHVWVGNDLSLMPAVANGPNAGTPIPGQFCQADGGACADATNLTTYTFTIPWDQLNITNIADICDADLYVVTHAEVDLDCSDGGFNYDDHETAFGGDVPVNVDDPGRWWFYSVYTVCCDFGNQEIPFCQTAYAKGGYVWTTQRRSNPEGLPSLELTKNRWGWAIKLAATGTTTYDIWAGAGLNDTDKGTLVGELTVQWNGTDVTVTYSMDTGYCMEEVHVYAGDDAPTTIAPGQYGHIAEFDPNETEYSVTLPLEDSNGGGVWIVAHAVVCNECD